MGKIIRPDLIKFIGKEHEDTEQLLSTLRRNRTMALTLLRRRSLFEGFSALAKEDEENAGYWEEIAKDCNRLCECLWNGETEDSAALEDLMKVLKRPMPEKPPTVEEVREKMISSLQGRGMNEILRRIKNALDTDEWKVLFTDEAYGKLKEMYSLRCTGMFLKGLDEKYILYITKDMRCGGVKKTVSEYVVEWCLDVAAENLVKKEEEYLLNEKFWTGPYDTEREKLLEKSYFHTAAELLRCWDEGLSQEPGSTLENSSRYEKCKASLELEEKKLGVLEEAYSLFMTCRRKFADGTWFELWENSEVKGEERAALFFLAAGKASVDRTDFDRIWRAESDTKYSDSDSKELGWWYWNQGIRLAQWAGRVASQEYKSEVGQFRVPRPAAEAVRYILNELSKWKKKNEETVESIKKNARSRTLESSIREAKKLLEKCESHLRMRQAEMDAVFCIKGAWSEVYWEKKVKLYQNKGKKQGYYLVACEKPTLIGMSAKEYYEVLQSVVMHHRYSKWYRIFKRFTFGWNRKNQKRHVKLHDSIERINRTKRSCECFVETRKRLHEKMRMECKKMRDRETELMEIVPGKYAEVQSEGLFSYWERQWDALNRRYREFHCTKIEWEKEESAHWEKEVHGFKKDCESYKELLSRTFDDCYCLLELKKERGKKKWGLKKSSRTYKLKRKQRPHKKAKVRSVRRCFDFSSLFRKKR